MAAYQPAQGAISLQNSQTFASFLSQRDLSLQIPINYVTHAGVCLRPACFADERYDETAFSKCFSNLLATGFRRIEADVYWDSSRQTWSLCPVELGDANDAPSASSNTVHASRPTSMQLSTRLLTARDHRQDVATVFHARRQSDDSALPLPGDTSSSTSTNTPSVSTTVTLGANTPTSNVANPVATSSSTSNGTLIQVGPYECTPGVDFALLLSVLTGHLADTETNLNATTVVLTLNIHAAAPMSDPSASAQAPAQDDLPDFSSLLSEMISNDASSFLYTPNNLINQRQNLNQSHGWFTVDRSAEPAYNYYQINDDGGKESTPDGWPNEDYMELQRAERLLVEFGEIDPQMLGYNFSGDSSTIFPSRYLDSPRTVTTDSAGNITSGCVFNPSITSIAAANSSWATTALGNDSTLTGSALDFIIDQTRNLTYCGISSILNATLNNVTADRDFTPYTAFVESTVWSWAPGQPINASASEGLTEFRCAALNSTSGYWQAADCSQSHWAACRHGGQPYSWDISSAAAPYARVDLGCDDNSTFDVPRTSLENSHLLYAWRSWQRDHDDDSGPLLWLDFNDLDVSACWVIGQNTSCPYDAPSGKADTREVVVPVIAGIIVFVLAVLTILVKCAGNRQQSKRKRRRGDDGWDYEGVPS